MCDYSLELYRSQPARQGAAYETHRFPSGSIGFIARHNANTAVCMSCDTRLSLRGIPDNVQQVHHVTADEEVIFIRLETGPYHDGVRFTNGKKISLQLLGTGVKAEVIDALTAVHKMPMPAEAL